MEAAAVTSGVIVTASSMSIFATVLLFPTMLTGKLFMHVIIMIAFCNLLLGVAIMFGFPTGQACKAQGFIIHFFQLGSWFWTVFLAYSLYCLVMYQKMLMSLEIGHLIVWSFCLILSSIPFAGSCNELPPGLQGTSLCLTCMENECIPSLLGTVVIPLWCCVILMMYFVRCILRKKSLEKRNEKVSSAISILFLYPICLCIFWTPLHIADIYWMTDPNWLLKQNSLNQLNILELYGIWYAVASVIIFFANSGDARRHWYNLLCRNLIKSKDSCPSGMPVVFDRNSIDIGDSVGLDGVDINMANYPQNSVFEVTRSDITLSQTNSLVVDDSTIELTVMKGISNENPLAVIKGKDIESSKS